MGRMKTKQQWKTTQSVSQKILTMKKIGATEDKLTAPKREEGKERALHRHHPHPHCPGLRHLSQVCVASFYQTAHVKISFYSLGCLLNLVELYSVLTGNYSISG